MNQQSSSTLTTVEQMYSCHHSWLYTWLSKRMGNRHDAADIAHDTFIKLIQLPEHNYSQPRAMLTTIAKNLAINFWRRKQIEQIYYDTLLHTQQNYVPSAEEELIAIQILYQLHQAFCQLQSRQQQVFLLSQNTHLTYQDIAQQLDISLSTVKRDMKQIYICFLTLLTSDS